MGSCGRAIPFGARILGSVFVPCVLALWSVWGASGFRIPSFSGHIQENSPAGSAVLGLDMPLSRLSPEPWCAAVRGRRWHLQLVGESWGHFELFLHPRRGRVSLRSTRALDREERAEYRLYLVLCCQLCLLPHQGPASMVTKLAAVTITILDENDNAPRFTASTELGPRISLEETAGLRSIVGRVCAQDPDQGTNAEIVYYAEPANIHFFVIPKTGQVILVNSLLNLKDTINLTLYARDRGHPPLVSAPLEVEICPKTLALPLEKDPRKRPARSLVEGHSAEAWPRPLYRSQSEDTKAALHSKGETKPAVHSKEETKHAMHSKEETKPALHSKGETKPAVYSKEETKHAMLSKEETKPAVHKKEDTKPAVYSKEETKPAVYSKEETKPAVYSKEETKPAVHNKEETKPAVHSKEETKADLHIKEETEPVQKSKDESRTPVGTKPETRSKDKSNLGKGYTRSETQSLEPTEPALHSKEDAKSYPHSKEDARPEPHFKDNIPESQKDQVSPPPELHAEMSLSNGNSDSVLPLPHHNSRVAIPRPHPNPHIDLSEPNPEPQRALSFPQPAHPNTLSVPQSEPLSVYPNVHSDFLHEQSSLPSPHGPLPHHHRTWSPLHRSLPHAHSPLPHPQGTLIYPHRTLPHSHSALSVPHAGPYMALSVPEDAAPGSLLITLSHSSKFPYAWFELLSPSGQDSELQVGKETGEITVARALDRERASSLEFIFKVRDRTGPDWYLTRLQLTILDVNDNVPQWATEPFPFLAVVSPQAAPGSDVYRLLARDADEGAHGQVEYFLLEGGNDRFQVDRNTGWIRTTGLSLVKDKEYLLTVQAADKLGKKGSLATVSVIAGPRPPQFSSETYTVHLPENTPQGQTFIKVLASSFQNKSLSYSLLLNPSSMFSIHQVTGEISLTRSVDYESGQHQHQLLVKATENLEQFTSTAEVLVVVTDVNDCIPEFQQSVYSKDNVPETVPIGLPLLQVTAKDCDSGLNSEVAYHTLSPDFSISPKGTIAPVRHLDFERPNHLYEFVVMATDKGEEPKTGTATIRIRMSNVNDGAPEFSQPIYRSFVSEDAGPNTLVATVHASDPDGDGVSYKLSGGNQEGNFVVDPHKGLIRLRPGTAPTFHGTEYVLNVTAIDDNASGGPSSLSSVAQVIVRINDVNNNKPLFQKCQYYRDHAAVLENQAPGTSVLQVEATDADEGPNGRVKYGIMHRDGIIPAFSIHPDTGILTTLERFDREQQREYSITVTATDQAAEPLIGICQINIVILDQNDNDPRFENIRYEHFLREDTVVGNSFLRVTAHDDDYGTNAMITYSMSGEELKFFHINPSTGWVYVNQPITKRAFIMQEIIATDGGNRSSKVELAVTVTNAKNQPPVWEKDTFEIVIPENTVRDTVIVTIKAISPLGDPRVTYNLEEGLVPEANMPVRFYLTPNREDRSASVLVAEPLDYESTRSFLLKVRAQNVAAVPLAAFATIRINLTDVNDNVPFFSSSIYEASVTEGAPAGTFVLQVSANDLDLDLNGKVTYSLLHDRNGDNTFFRIDPDTGSVYTTIVFDREVKGSYLLELKSTDGSESARPGKHGQPNSDTAYARITVSDLNDNRPVFAQGAYQVDVDEDQDVGDPVITVSANDEDEGANAKVRYLITAGNIGGVLDVEPETGLIFISQPLDYEEVRRFELDLSASDGKWEDYATVVINVINKNDEAPLFTSSEYYGSVMEELTELPFFILQVSASDPDDYVNQGDIRYSLHGHGTENVFAIDEKLGNIFVQKPLDREERALWRFVVLATDEGGEGLTGFADVIINIKDINDNSPKFTCMPNNCNGSVHENSPADSLVMEMNAVDLDDAHVGSNAVLTYRIIDNPKHGTNTDLFHINPATGTIHLAVGHLDREANDKYFLTVEANDGGGLKGTATATIRVLDVNDHVPEFMQSFWQTVISETIEIHSPVLEVSVTDADIGENAQLTFSIIDGDAEKKFYIENNKHSQHATIRLKKKVDYEKPQERMFNLTVKVEDISFSSTATCVITVEDSNDHSPVFVPQFLQVAPIFENVTIGTTIAKMTATDDDSGLNGYISYWIQAESDPLKQFVIDQAGHIMISGALDREVIQQYTLIALSRDRGTPPQTGSATVLINVLDVNDNGPVFENLYAPVVWENIVGPQVVYVNQTSDLLYAVDPDTVANGKPFTFLLPPEHQNSLDFALADNGNNTATLTALRLFDREKQKEFHLPIIIRDSGNPPMSATNILTITIGDENDNPHASGHKDIYVYTHKGKWPPTALGQIFSPDEDDWHKKTFDYERSLPRYFKMNKKTGTLTMTDNAPPGTYNLQFSVSDDVWPDVISTVKVHVKELEDEAIQKSATLRVKGFTAEEFMCKDEFGVSKLDRFKELIAEILQGHPSDIEVFSVANTKGRQADLRFAVYSSSGICYAPEKIHGEISAHKDQIQLALKADTLEIGVDGCAKRDCSGGSGCTSSLTVTAVPSVMDAGNTSLVSITPTVSAVCTCEARDKVHQSCASYGRNPCLNGGTCVDSQIGYRCRCFPEFDGPDCQQTERSFRGSGFVWFPPLRPCSDSHLSLEFIADVPNGLLLYSGPLSASHPGHSQDFLSIELSNGVPMLTVSHEEGSLLLKIPSQINVTDRQWHRLDVRSTRQHVQFTLDRCRTAVISEVEGVGPGLSSDDRSVCELTAPLALNRSFWSGHPVLQLGGVKESIPYSYPGLQHKHFTGCLRNLILDSQVYDLRLPASSLNSSPGCAHPGNGCSTGSSCRLHGGCTVKGDSEQCLCMPGDSGHQCADGTKEYSFAIGSHVLFELPAPVSVRETMLEVMIRTRQAYGYIMSLSSRGQSEHINLKVLRGFLTVSYNLGDGDYTVKLPSITIDNGEWHRVTLERFDNEFTLRLNGGGGMREVTRATGKYKEIVIDPSSLVIGNSFPIRRNTSFEGCMKDVWFNNYLLPLTNHSTQPVLLRRAYGVTEGCFSDACRNSPCREPFICTDLWRMHECSCAEGSMIVENATGRHCLPTPCAKRPCKHGTCVSPSPTKFSCQCPKGYVGRKCEITVAIFHQDAGLSFRSMFAICVCFSALLVVFVGVFLWTRWKSKTSLNEGVYHISAYHDDLEEIRENILNYNEEGGGEKDQDTYNMVELQLSLQTSPTFCPSKQTEDCPVLEQSSYSITTTRRKDNTQVSRSASLTSEEFTRYLWTVVQEADQQEEDLFYDSLKVYCTEGEGSLAGSLSTLDSATQEEDLQCANLKDWGSKFDKLNELYSHEEEEDV